MRSRQRSTTKQTIDELIQGATIGQLKFITSRPYYFRHLSPRPDDSLVRMPNNVKLTASQFNLLADSKGIWKKAAKELERRLLKRGLPLLIPIPDPAEMGRWKARLETIGRYSSRST